MGSSADLLKVDPESEAPEMLKERALREFANRLRNIRAERREAASLGREALARLVEVCSHKSGQGATVRAALYSIWNGAPRSLRGCITGIDWEIHKDLCAVMLAFGWDGDAVSSEFWDSVILQAFRDGGLEEWFLQEAINNDL